MLNTKRILVLVAIVAMFLVPAKLFAIDGSHDWLNAADPEFAIKQDLVSDGEYPNTYGQRGNIDCDSLSFTKRNGDALPFLPVHSESQISGCYINTYAGELDPNGYINVNQGEYAAELVHADNTAYKPLAFPNSDVFFSRVGSASGGIGNYVWLDHLLTSLVYQKDNYGRIRGVISANNQTAISDKNGNKLPVMSDNFGISDNGQWAVVDSPGKALLRINLATMEVLPFTNSFEYGNGIGAALRYAITSDGQYVAVASKNYNTFKVFDLSTCSNVPSTITTYVSSCKFRDVNSFVKSKISGFSSVLQMRFLSSGLIQFFASYVSGPSILKAKYVIATPGTDLNGMDYLAMGDSFSSGEGSFKYEVGTDETDYNLCHLSKVSYPYLLAKAIRANSFHSVACSGAKTVNIVGGAGIKSDPTSQNRDNQYVYIPPNNSLGSWIPGYQKQLNFMASNNPSMVTLSVGGNDIDFSDMLISCLKPGTCFPSYEDRQEVFNEIDGKLKVLVRTFKKTKSSASKEARIFVIGYPQIAYVDGNCGLNVHLNHDELVLASSIITRLNTVIKTAASQAGISYVDIEDALNGFRLCENNDGNLAMNGLTAGNDIKGLIGNESYHPTEFGQSLMANRILGLTSYLGTTNPDAESNNNLDKISESDPALANVTKTGRNLRKRISNGNVAHSYIKTDTLSVPVSNLLGLTPNSTYQIFIDGNQAGTVATDSHGNATAEITVPENIADGPSSVDIIGTDVTGQEIDISSVINIITPDNSNICSVITDSGIDIDQDGIDDACDNIIGPAPISDTNTLPPSSESGAKLYYQATSSPSDEQVVTVTGQLRPAGEGSVLLRSAVYEEDDALNFATTSTSNDVELDDRAESIQVSSRAPAHTSWLDILFLSIINNSLPIILIVVLLLLLFILSVLRSRDKELLANTTS